VKGRKEGHKTGKKKGRFAVIKNPVFIAAGRIKEQWGLGYTLSNTGRESSPRALTKGRREGGRRGRTRAGKESKVIFTRSRSKSQEKYCFRTADKTQ